MKFIIESIHPDDFKFHRSTELVGREAQGVSVPNDPLEFCSCYVNDEEGFLHFLAKAKVRFQHGQE